MTAPAVPANPAEFEDYLGSMTPETVNASIKDGSFAREVKAYAEKIHAKDQAISQQVKEQVQLAMADMLEANGQKGDGPRINLNERTGRPELAGKPGYGPNAKAVGAELNGMFPDFTTFAQNVWNKWNRDGDITDKLQKIMDYQERVPADGGFLVPEEFRAELFQLAYESALVRPRAQVVPMNSLTLRYPKVDETSRVSSVYGGIIVYRTEEGAELVESQAQFSFVKLEATKQTALAVVTNELVRDWGGFDSFIRSAFPQALAYFEDYDFTNGNGVGAPKGALVAANTSLITVPARAGQASATIQYENILDMYSRMLPSSLGNAVWIASPDCLPELGTMALNVGTGGSSVWLPEETGVTNAPPLTLFGRPLILTEKAPGALGAAGDLSFVDFGMYLIGDRQMMTIDSSEHAKFTSDRTVYKMIARNDGQPWLDSPITPHNNSKTLSPFVQLAPRP